MGAHQAAAAQARILWPTADLDDTRDCERDIYVLRGGFWAANRDKLNRMRSIDVRFVYDSVHNYKGVSLCEAA